MEMNNEQKISLWKKIKEIRRWTNGAVESQCVVKSI